MMHRLQFFKPSPFYTLLPKCPSLFTTSTSYPYRNCTLRLDCTRTFASSSTSDQQQQVNSNSQKQKSIVGDLLDYLNESWTQFHATVNTDGFKPNLETHLIPLLATKVDDVSSPKNVYHPLLMKILSKELDCEIEEIISLELNICDTQPSCLGGGNDEFIFTGKLNNLASSFVR